MNFKNHIYNFLIPAILIGLTFLSSCVDDDLKGDSFDSYDPAEDPEMVCLPLSIAMDFSSVSTREGETSADTKDDTENPQLSQGSESDHIIDFDLPNECYAIFFKTDDKGKDKVEYIQPIYLNSQLGSGTEQPAPNIEYRVPVVTYIPVKDTEIVYEDSKKTKIRYYQPKLTKVLVVLNGGKIYNKFVKTIYNDPDTKKDVKSDVSLENILAITWDNAATYRDGAWIGDSDDSDGRIGFNSREHFTLTSAAYWKFDEDDKKYHLMTATPIIAKAYQSIKDYVDYLDNPDKFKDPDKLVDDEKFPEKSVSIPVERMVSRFYAPTFQTEVIGAERVFRPDQNAMPVIIHIFEGDNLKKLDKNWRIHLLGWSINGDESKSYVFKNIGNISPNYAGNGLEYKDVIENINEFGWPTWNDIINYRTYWSIDPHYFDSRNDFYPWQYRKAADRSDIISVQAGISSITPVNPALRYNTFKDILNEWQWRDVLHIHENTFDPAGEWYENPMIENNKFGNNLDNRASILAGPHLLIAGEVYIEVDSPEDEYVYSSSNVKFKRVDHLYADRIRRYYYKETDWLKMFLQDINQSLSTLEYMDFPCYDWDASSSDKRKTPMQAITPRKPRLYFGDQLLTNNLIEILAKDPDVTLSIPANMRNGDGRVIPWIEQNKNGKKTTLKIMVDQVNDKGEVIVDAKGNPILRELEYTEDKVSGSKAWDDDMYKSFFLEWFGAIDHYVKGYMYYAGDIKHHNAGGRFSHDFYGTVRNHSYKFHVESINSLGIPVDDPEQFIIPGLYNYRDQLMVYLTIETYHQRTAYVDVP